MLDCSRTALLSPLAKAKSCRDALQQAACVALLPSLSRLAWLLSCGLAFALSILEALLHCRCLAAGCLRCAAAHMQPCSRLCVCVKRCRAASPRAAAYRSSCGVLLGCSCAASLLPLAMPKSRRAASFQAACVDLLLSSQRLAWLLIYAALRSLVYAAWRAVCAASLQAACVALPLGSRGRSAAGMVPC